MNDKLVPFGPLCTYCCLSTLTRTRFPALLLNYASFLFSSVKCVLSSELVILFQTQSLRVENTRGPCLIWVSKLQTLYNQIKYFPHIN